MDVFEKIADIRRAVSSARRAGRTVGFVPTMGALHEGHLSLIRAARSACEMVVVSIFVNPTQFGPSEDFDRYPRPVEADLASCRGEGVHALFMPAASEMYGPGAMTEVSVPALSGALCGASRPGHFNGVCLVVAKLFNIVQPDKAFFGAKDFQQAAIITRLAADLNFPLEVVVCPTVREADGLAMSSRNAHLSPDERRQAAELYQALAMAGRMVRCQAPPAGAVVEAIESHIRSGAPSGEIDYVRIVDPQTLVDVETTSRRVLIALAVRFSAARLIDNIVVEPPGANP